MLFTDSDIADAAVLGSLDPEISSVVGVVSKDAPITLSGPESICEHAWSECRSKLEAALTTYTCYYGQAGMQAHLAAVMNTGSWGGSYGTHARVRLSQIVAHDTYYANSLSPLQRWVGYSALRMLFQEAANRFVGNDKYGDRFEQKRDRYAADAKRLWSQVLTQGLPIVVAYLDAPGSKHGYNAGSWSNDNLSSVIGIGADVEDEGVQVAITYVDGSKYLSPSVKNNAESGPSETLSANITAGELLTVDISSLNPPSSANPPPVGVSQGIAPMLNATGWLCYAGKSAPGAPLYLQSPSPIPIGTKTFTLPGTLIGSGPTLGPGQFPNTGSNIIFGNALVRG